MKNAFLFRQTGFRTKIDYNSLNLKYNFGKEQKNINIQLTPSDICIVQFHLILFLHKHHLFLYYLEW